MPGLTAICGQYGIAGRIRSFQLDLQSRWNFSVAWGANRFGLGLLFALIARKYAIPWGRRAYAWVIGGAAASMLFDGAAILGGVDEIKF